MLRKESVRIHISQLYYLARYLPRDAAASPAPDKRPNSRISRKDVQPLVSETKLDKNTDSRVYSGPTEIGTRPKCERKREKRVGER